MDKINTQVSFIDNLLKQEYKECDKLLGDLVMNNIREKIYQENNKIIEQEKSQKSL